MASPGSLWISVCLDGKTLYRRMISHNIMTAVEKHLWVGEFKNVEDLSEYLTNQYEKVLKRS